MKLRIHHFYDIIRDFGSGKEIMPHPYGHSYHLIAEVIKKDPHIKIKIVVSDDHVCSSCNHLIGKHCTDTINHRSDFTAKEKFNNYLDRRILSVFKIKEGEIYTPAELCEKSNFYLDNIEWIYEGNDEKHTEKRKNNVLKGLKYYKEKHSLNWVK